MINGSSVLVFWRNIKHFSVKLVLHSPVATFTALPVGSCISGSMVNCSGRTRETRQVSHSCCCFTNKRTKTQFVEKLWSRVTKLSSSPSVLPSRSHLTPRRRWFPTWILWLRPAWRSRCRYKCHLCRCPPLKPWAERYACIQSHRRRPRWGHNPEKVEMRMKNILTFVSIIYIWNATLKTQQPSLLFWVVPV